MADIYVFENNAGSTLLTGIGSGDVQLTVAVGEGARFPAPASGEIAALTLVDSILGLLEIVTLTTRSADVLTIVRGQEGTTPLAFTAGTTVSHRVTKGTLEWLQGLSVPPAGGFVLLAPASGNSQVITPGDAADIGLAIQGVIGQAGNLQEWRNSSDAIMASISSDGAAIFAEAVQGLRLQSLQAGTEAVPSILVGGTELGFRRFGSRFAVVVDNTDAAVFEEELVILGNLDNLSIITKRLGDLLYFPLTGGVLQGPFKLEVSDPFLDLADADAPAFPGFNRIRFLNEMQAFSIQLRDNSESLLAEIIKVPYNVSGAIAIENYIAGTLAATVDAVGVISPSAQTVITREKGDARFTPIAHATDTGDPHDVQAVQVDYTGALGSDVQAALDSLEAVPPGGVQSVFGRSGVIIAVLADYQAFYLDLAGGTLTGALDLVGGATGDEAASSDDVDAKVATHTAVSNPHSDSLATSSLASQAEAEAGVDNTKWMTPLRTAQAAPGPGPFESKYFHVRDEKPDGTQGGTFTKDIWQTRDLNTILTNEIGATVASNRFTLTNGEYYIRARAPVRGDVNQHKARLRQTSSPVSTMLLGSNARTGGGDMGDSWVVGRFTVSGTKTFALEHRCGGTNANDGFGQASNMGVIEVYAEVEIWKLS